MKDEVILGGWSKKKLDTLVATATKIKAVGERVAFLSGQFIGTPYKESTLIGNETTPERLVANFETFDCFTFLDCIEAMRLSRSFVDFRTNLVRLRYKEGIVAYERRNHFFTDWLQHNAGFVHDVTADVGSDALRAAVKTLNQKNDGSSFVSGIKSFERTISYIPGASVSKSVLAGLMTGDYIGIFSDLAGLDVSHVGIVVKEGSADIRLRHASSVVGRVVDQDFPEYVSGKPGIIVVRPF